MNKLKVTSLPMRSENISAKRMAHFGLAPLALSIGLILSACGGDSSSTSTSPTSSSATSVTQGTVTGLGSVFVDGVELQDATASVQEKNADGSMSNTSVKMGQHVRVMHDKNGNASQVVVSAAVIGSVSAVSATGLTVAGQNVVVNSNATAGLVTMYGDGYASLADIAVNDVVAVHGDPVYNSTTKVYDIHATRIEKRPTATGVSMEGSISALNTTAKTFVVNGLTVNYAGMTVQPAATTLVNGTNVHIWGSAPTTNTTTGITSTNATRIAVDRDSGSSDQYTHIAGLVTSVNASANTLILQGNTVNTSKAVITPAGTTMTANSYIRVDGTFDSAGVLQATAINVRPQNTVDAGLQIHLDGAISGYVNNSNFVVRGIPVDASAINMATACPNLTLANGIFVKLTATPQVGTDVVKATSLSCPAATPNYAMREQRGTISAVTPSTTDTTTGKFTLTSTIAATTSAAATTSTTTVLWNAQTAFANGVTAATLSTTTAAVKVEGYLDASGNLVARVVRLADTEDHDRFDHGSTLNPTQGAKTTSLSRHVVNAKPSAAWLFVECFKYKSCP